MICLLIFGTIDIGHSEDCDRPIYLSEVTVVAKPFDEMIYDNLVGLGVSPELALIVVAQAKHESGNYNSDIFWENHNFFGMKHPRKRKTTSIGSSRGHAVYLSFEDAITDYFYYLEVFGYPLDEKVVKRWVILLKNKGYFEDSFSRYYNGVKYFHENV